MLVERIQPCQAYNDKKITKPFIILILPGIKILAVSGASYFTKMY
jgi:hypothetical protein